MCYNEISIEKERVIIVLKILICDDSITIRKKLQGAIDLSLDTTFFEAKNGQEAVEQYQLNQPDIVFMDIIMPEMDGIDALKAIMQIDGDAKVIMLSSVGTKANLKTALENGASDFIQKPWDIKNLNTIITKYI